MGVHGAFGREDGDRWDLTHNFNPSHTCVGFGMLLRGMLWTLTFRRLLSVRAGTRELQPELQEQIWRNVILPMPMHHCCQLICLQSVMLYTLIGVYLSNLATEASYLELIPTCGFSCVWGKWSLFSWDTFPSMVAMDQSSSSCEASFWKLKSIEVNYTYWCKVRIDVGVKFNLSASLVTSLCH